MTGIDWAGLRAKDTLSVGEIIIYFTTSSRSNQALRTQPRRQKRLRARYHAAAIALVGLACI